MLSKLTFSLALVLMFAFVAGPVLAQGTTTHSAAITVAELPKDGFHVLEKAAGNGIDTNLAGTSRTTGAFLDLETLLRFGGMIELSIVIPALGDVDGSATGVVVATEAAMYTVAYNATAADLATMKHHLLISEVMWGLDASPQVDAQDDRQWIEIYNHGGLKESDAPMLHFSTGTIDRIGQKVPYTINTATVNRVVVDRVSTVDRFRGSWGLDGKGNGGRTVALPATAGDPGLPTTNLVSMYRNATIDKDGVKYMTNVDDAKVIDGVGDGNLAGSWSASVGRVNMMGAFIGSPASVHVGTGGGTKTFAKLPASIPGTSIVINEVRNDSSDANLDWVELYNNSASTSASINIDGYELNIVTRGAQTDAQKAAGTYPEPTEVTLVDEEEDQGFPPYKIAPGEYLVIYNRHPGDTILAGGVNIEDVPAGKQVNKGASHSYLVRAQLDLPSDKGKFLLILRSAVDKNDTGEVVVDFAGNGFFPLLKLNEFDTDTWPFVAWPVPAAEDVGDNSFASRTQSWGRIATLSDTGSYVPHPVVPRDNERFHEDDWQAFDGTQGGVGYDRDVDLNNAPGTPGYANVVSNLLSDDRDSELDASKAAKGSYIFGGTVTISEVMYDAGERWNLIQWIELYNSSLTEAIDISGWELEIRNKEDVESYVDSSFTFVAGTTILPNQTLLIVSGTGANDVDSNRVYNLYQHHRRALGLLARDSVLLSRTGFYLKLVGKASVGGQIVEEVVDEAGNVMVVGATRTVVWDLEPRDPAARQSLVRQYGTRDIDGTPDAADDGTMESSWNQSDLTGAGLSYYGHRNDIGTPGYRLGGPLPVSLSSFRPVRDKTTGEVVIRWITESELNNAGFNILRSESKDGEFQVVNLKGIIAGNGTTSERHVYEWTDTAAKPNVVYYYQIEDVSLDGNRTTLDTTHLRGNVTVAGKATTTWADLKSLK